jgi:propionyl-CoA synthetase
LIRGRDLGEFRALFLAGERADPPTVAWAEEQLGIPVIDHWWQTETGWPIAANCLGVERLPVKHGSATRAVPGWDVRVLDAEAEGMACELAPGEIGALAIKLPLPAHRLSTGEIEEVLAAHPDVAECAVIGVADALKGQVPLGLLVLKAGVVRTRSSAKPFSSSAIASARWRASRQPLSSPVCRRPARARSYAARCV